MSDPDLLTIEEVAQLLRVSRDTVYRLAAKGDVPGKKVGRIWRFRREAIEAWASRRFGEERGRRERAEAELADSVSRYHDHYENAPDMFATVELPSGTVVECNQTLAIETGFRKEELLGRNFADLHEESDAARAADWLATLASSGQGPEIDLTLRRRDDDGVQASLRASALRDSDGEVVRGRLVWRDFETREHAERALRADRSTLQQRVSSIEKELTDSNRRLLAEKERMRQLFETVGAAILVLGRDGRIREWNPEAERVFGWKRSEVLGQPFVDRFIHADYRSRFGAAFERAMKLEATHGFGTRTVGRDDDHHCLVWNLTPQPPIAEDRPAGVLTCGQDITELVRSRDEVADAERRFREIADAVNAVFWVSEWVPGARSFAVRYVSPAFERIWGRTRESIYANPEEWIEGIVPEERDGVARQFYDLVENERYDTWYHIRRPDGDIRRIHDRGRAKYDEYGRIVSAMGLAEDVTDRPNGSPPHDRPPIESTATPEEGSNG